MLLTYGNSQSGIQIETVPCTREDTILWINSEPMKLSPPGLTGSIQT